VISSTAATISNARRSASEELTSPLAAGAISAGAVSMVRTSFLVIVLARPLAAELLPVLFSGAAAMLVYAVLLARQSSAKHQEVLPKNPFDLDEVVKMAVVLVGVGFLARAASEIFGDAGLFIASAVSGLADVDAATIAVAGLLPTLSLQTASLAIAIAVLSNTLAKAVYASIFGTMAFGAHVWKASILAIAAAALCFGMLRSWL
jgi:uncharacterized membrane protein (DUF4010 family)